MQCDFKGGAYIEKVKTSHENSYFGPFLEIGRFWGEMVALHSRLAVVAWAGLSLSIMVSYFLISLETTAECQM